MTAELKAGFFVLVGLAALVYMTTRLTQNRYSFAGTKRYYASVGDATGLLNKTKVKMAGLDVGQVETIELVGKRARLTLEIAADMNLHKDASVSVKAIGFLGDKYIELHPGTDAAGPLEEGANLPEVVSGAGIDQLTQKTTEVLENIREITNVLKEALRGAGEEEETRLDRILDNMEAFSQGLAQLDRLGDVADRLAEVAGNIRDVTAKVKRGEGTLGKLLTDSETIDKINSTLSGVNKFFTKADKMEVIVDARSGYLTSSATARSAFSLIIRPTYDKYYLFGLTSSPRGSQTITRTETTSSPDSSTATTTVTSKKETEETGVTFNAQFAKRWEDLTFKIGLFESTGGVGFDYDLWRDRVSLTSELYRFRKDDTPQLNVSAVMHLYRPFFLWAGGDDVASASRRNFLVGGGIRFSDQDIKALATAAAAGR